VRRSGPEPRAFSREPIFESELQIPQRRERIGRGPSGPAALIARTRSVLDAANAGAKPNATVAAAATKPVNASTRRSSDRSFLAATLFGGTVERTCTVPAGKELFFPVINSVNIDTPNVCGQGPERIPVEDLRAFSAAFIEGATNLSVELDGKEIRELHNVRTKVFEVAGRVAQPRHG
jgi:hypothetical protein